MMWYPTESAENLATPMHHNSTTPVKHGQQ